MFDKTKDTLILVGAIAGPHGVRGDVKLLSFTGEPEDIAAYGALITEDGREFEIEKLKPAAKGFVARLKGVTSRAQAEALKSTSLYVSRANLPDTDEDEFYHADLIGLAVVSEEGEHLGTLIGVHDFGAGDLIEVAPKTGKTYFVPLTKEAVPHVDLAGGLVTIAPPEEIEGEAPAETPSQ